MSTGPDRSVVRKPSRAAKPSRQTTPTAIAMIAATSA